METIKMYYMSYIEVVKVTWWCILGLWIFLYLKAQLDRINIFDREGFRRSIESAQSDLDKSKGFMFYVAIIFLSAYLYPIKSFILWVVLVFLSIKL